MSFQDEIAKVIESALNDKNQERQDSTALDAEWNRLRSNVVLPLLQDAARAFRVKTGDAHAGFTNGSVRLTLGYGGKQPYLDFGLDKQVKNVLCKSSLLDGDPEERFDLENLTEEVVKDKVERFVYHVIRGKRKDDGSVYDKRGLTVL